MLSKCGTCGGFSFEIREITPSRSNFKKNFIQCSLCGVPVGITDYMDTYTAISSSGDRIKNKLDELDSKLSHIQYGLTQIANSLNRKH